MSRALGKHHVPRRPADVEEIDPDSPEGRQLGMSVRMQGTPSPIPGGLNHIGNAPAVRQETPVPDARPEITDQNAHGVPPGTATTRERADLERGPNSVHSRANPPEKVKIDLPAPIPVYVVQEHHAAALRTASPHHITLQASGLEPVRLCGRDLTRMAIWLLNESSTDGIRFAQRQSDLNNGGGALLGTASTSYLKLDTQDELWGISADSGTPTISIIQVFERMVD